MEIFTDIITEIFEDAEDPRNAYKLMVGHKKYLAEKGHEWKKRLGFMGSLLGNPEDMQYDSVNQLGANGASYRDDGFSQNRTPDGRYISRFPIDIGGHVAEGDFYESGFIGQGNVQSHQENTVQTVFAQTF